MSTEKSDRKTKSAEKKSTNAKSVRVAMAAFRLGRDIGLDGARDADGSDATGTVPT